MEYLREAVLQRKNCPDCSFLASSGERVECERTEVQLADEQRLELYRDKIPTLLSGLDGELSRRASDLPVEKQLELWQKHGRTALMALIELRQELLSESD